MCKSCGCGPAKEGKFEQFLHTHEHSHGDKVHAHPHESGHSHHDHDHDHGHGHDHVHAAGSTGDAADSAGHEHGAETAHSH